MPSSTLGTSASIPRCRNYCMNSEARVERPGAWEGGQSAARAGRPLLPALLRPLEIGDLLDEAFDLYRRNFRLFFGIMVILDLPITLLQIQLTDPQSAPVTVWLGLGETLIANW